MSMSPPTRRLPSFSTTSVLVAGDVMLDRYWHGAAERISPEAPVPVVRLSDLEKRAGGAANVAANVAALGAEPRLLGVTGEDESGAVLRELIAGQGIWHRLVAVRGYATVTKMRVLARHQQLIRLDVENDGRLLDASLLREACAEALPGCAAVVLSDYGKGALNGAQELIALVAGQGGGQPVLVDPKGRDFGRYRGATLLTPNLAEFEAVVGHCADLEALERKARELCRALELRAVVITRGEQGMSLVPAEGAAWHEPARAREVYDVTGAGDTVIALLASALGAGQTLADAMVFANAAAGVVVGKLGAACASVAEIERVLAPEEALPAARVLEGRELPEALAASRRAGERLVMTNGCFDILHAGHAQYLGAARALGNRLLVAVNDDDSVRRLKGGGRPLNALEARMELLAALRCVDWVVPFSEDTPESLIAQVRPDVLVKGGDYQASEVAGGEQVRAAGGEVVILPYRTGYSTTDLACRLVGEAAPRPEPS